MVVSNLTFPTINNLQNGCSGLVYCTAKWAYQVVGFFWGGMIMAFMVVLFIATQRFGNARAFGFASFSGMMAAIIFATMILIPWWIASIFILLGVLGLAVLLLNEH